jgi:hypothetical protein
LSGTIIADSDFDKMDLNARTRHVESLFTSRKEMLNKISVNLDTMLSMADEMTRSASMMVTKGSEIMERYF